MSLFAGVYALRDESGQAVEIPADVSRILTESLGRGPDRVQTFETPGFHLAKVDVGAFGEPGVLDDDRSLAAVAGELLLDRRKADTRPSRMQDLRRLAEEVSVSGPTALGSCLGTFALCHYDRTTGAFLVATDRVGVRPVYFYAGDGLLIFSTALRVLEAIDLIPKRMDLRGVTEEATIGFPLDDRTPYVDIKLLRSGEALRSVPGGYDREYYFRWRDVPRTDRLIEEVLRDAYERFLTAVDRRGPRDRLAISLLSGGLDSRCIVAALKGLAYDVRAITFDLVQTPDLPIAKEFARHVGVECDVRKGIPSQLPHDLIVHRPGEAAGSFAEGIASPQLIYSGDGGSVGLGFVYLTERIVSLLREGRTREAAESSLENALLPVKLFRPNAYRRLAGQPLRGVLNELARNETDDPVKAFFLYLLDNDQRRHLSSVYEDIDLRRVEYLLPFFDGAFLELIASAPADWFLYHRFYHRWLALFPPETTQIPWQTYPDHEPCPIGGLDFGPAQWDSTRKKRRVATRALLASAQSAFARRTFPHDLVRGAIVRFVYIAQIFGFSKYNYIMKTFVTFSKYYDRCGGRVANLDEP
jgi:asparagine synthase (glutamine-hydrolysing)